MDHKYEVLTHCRLCGRGDSLKMVGDLGHQPLANNLLPSSSTPVERYPLQLMVCNRCYLGQLSVVVDPEIVFGGHYPFQAGVSETWRNHCKLIAGYFSGLREGDWVVDIGSNDGTLLDAFKGTHGGVQLLGVEPANMKKNYACINNFWNMNTAKAVKYATGGGAKVITATNVLAHTPDLWEFIGAVEEALAPDGVFYFEVPDLRNLLRAGLYNTIYHEHYSYFSLQSIITLLSRATLTAKYILKHPIHGGSFGIPCDRDPENLSTYREEWLLSRDLFNSFQDRIEGLNAALQTEVEQAKGRVFGYGASAKAVVTLLLGKAWAKKVEGVFDDAPSKQGKWLPTNPPIPIYSPSKIKELKPDHIILLSLNLEADLMARARAEGFTGEFI